VRKIHHIAVAVSDLDEAESIYRDGFGLDWKGREEVSGQKVTVSIFEIGGSRIELVCPAAEDSPVAGFLEKRGNGLHHICIEVPDLNAALADLKNKGIHLLNETPVAGAGGTRVAFVHPRSAAGVLIELVEKSA
jgi:methylmalonyl-CoA/ethylmalonyl-CoA epimerase